MANQIQILRSTGTAAPSSLAAGELAWLDKGGFGQLYIRDAGNANDVIIGGPQMVKEPCLNATTANITLSGEQTLDGVLTSTSRILVKNQSTASENGIYVTAAGAWTRALDFDDQANVKEGMICTVQRGSTQADTIWMLTSDDSAIVVGTDAITFTDITGTGALTGGDGIDVTGNTVSVDLGTDPGLEFVTGTLEVLIDPNGGLQKVAAGIGFDGTVDGAGLTNTNGVLSVDALNTLPAPVGDLSMNSNKITSLTDPTAAQDAATKAYVDLMAAGLDPKGSVELVQIPGAGNLDLTGEETIDGVLTSSSRVLVCDQTAGEDNGIYVTGAGAWTRATDADTSAEVTAGMYVWVTEGSTYADTAWILTTNDPITLGTTSLSFSQYSGAGQLVAGEGLTKTAPNTLDVDLRTNEGLAFTTNQLGVVLDASGGLEFNGASGIRLEAAVAGTGLNHTTGVLSVTNTETDGFTGQTTYTAGDLLYADAANSLAKLALGTAVGSIGQFLKVNSGATNVEWSDIVDGGTF